MGSGWCRCQGPTDLQELLCSEHTSPTGRGEKALVQPDSPALPRSLKATQGSGVNIGSTPSLV